MYGGEDNMKIAHNIAGLNTLNRLNKNNKVTGSSLEKLSSGLRINKAADDAAGLGISEKMRAQIRGLDQAARNIQDGISLAQTAEGGLSQIENPLLQRLRELSLQAANGTLSPEDRQAIQAEIEQIKQAINDIANNTQFNGINLLNVPEALTATQPVSGTPHTTLSKVDITFLIDYSSSMGDVDDPSTRLGAVMDGISDFTDELNNLSLDSQIAIVSISTNSPSYSTFSNDPVTIKENMRNLSTWDSGTRPYQIMVEAAPEGTIGANLGYRPEAKKVFVLLTDARNESGTESEVTAKDILEGENFLSGYDQDDIQTYVFGFDGSLSTEDYDDITETTGGKIYRDISTTEQIKATLKNDLTKDISNNVDKPEPQNIKLSKSDLVLQVGANAGDTFKVDLTDARTTALGIDDVKVDPWEEAEKAISKLDAAIQQVSSERAKFGAYQNALEHIYSNVTNSSENLVAAESRIRDVDMAKEMMEFTKNNIVSQASQAMLAHANQQTQTVLQLLK